MENITIECPNCNQPLDLSFIVGQERVTKNSSTCHVCHRPYLKKKRVIAFNIPDCNKRAPDITQEMLEALKPKIEKICSGETKNCLTCLEDRPIEEFYIAFHRSGKKAGQSYRRSHCDSCRNKQLRLRYQQERNVISERSKALSPKQKEINKIKANERRKKFQQENPEYCRLQKARAAQKRRLSRRIRNRLSEVLKGERGLSFSKMLGCSSSELRTYMESKFLSGMTWDNYGYGHGQWVIDHVKPVALFDKSTKEELAKSCHYSNLQPLWYDMNEAKSDNYDTDHPMGWHGLDRFLIERGEPTPWLVG